MITSFHFTPHYNYGDWTGSFKYAGLRLTRGNNVHYGWAQIYVSRDVFSTGTAGATVINFAYETDAGVSIAASAGSLPGDADANGTVSFADLLILARNYNATTAMTWSTGDFNGDRRVNFEDLLTLARNYRGDTSVASPEAGDSFAADWAQAQSLVPEPGALATIAAVSLLSRRRR